MYLAAVERKSMALPADQFPWSLPLFARLNKLEIRAPVIVWSAKTARANQRCSSKEQVAAKAGYEASGGGFNNALGRLRTLELVQGRGELKTSRDLSMHGTDHGEAGFTICRPPKVPRSDADGCGNVKSIYKRSTI